MPHKAFFSSALRRSAHTSDAVFVWRWTRDQQLLVFFRPPGVQEIRTQTQIDQRMEYHYPQLLTDVSRPLPSEKLRSNHVPNAAESAEIKRHLLRCKSDLLSLDTDIIQIEAILRNLSDMRHEVQQHHDSFLSLLAPIRRLPPELLREIFLHSWGQLRQVFFKAEFPYAAPTTKGLVKYPALRICHHWNSIVAAFPTMFSKLSLYLHHEYAWNTPLDADPTLERLGDAITRSQSSSLDVKLLFTMTSDTTEGPLLPSILGESNRIRVLTLSYTGNFEPRQFLELARERSCTFSSLVELRVENLGWPSNVDPGEEFQQLSLPELALLPVHISFSYLAPGCLRYIRSDRCGHSSSMRWIEIHVHSFHLFFMLHCSRSSISLSIAAMPTAYLRLIIPAACC